ASCDAVSSEVLLNVDALKTAVWTDVDGAAQHPKIRARDIQRLGAGAGLQRVRVAIERCDFPGGLAVDERGNDRDAAAQLTRKFARAVAHASRELGGDGSK